MTSLKKKTYHWQFLQEQQTTAREIAAALGLNPAIARVLANRRVAADLPGLGIFMRPPLAGLHDPSGMRDMDRALERIASAMDGGEQITIYGDYDADGITSTALMVRLFAFLGHPVQYYIPHRLQEGYGLHEDALRKIASSGTRLIITVDNGISAHEQIAFAQRIGMDVVVTDHHRPAATLPDCAAVVNPNRADCSYPNPHLAGVGVAFKVAHALLRHRGTPQAAALGFLRSVLDLVAIGTVADVAPLIGENRAMVKHGLDRIAHSTNVGVVALKEMLDFSAGPVSAEKVGFQISPRLNAAGRTQHASVCVELLTTSDRARASDIADQLETCNRDRRSVEAALFEKSMAFVRRMADLDEERVLVVSGPEWHIGVIGIVASKLLDAFGRPAIVISELNGHGKGSARSVPGFDMHAALEACSAHLLGFGGHPGAAGLQIETHRIAAFREAMNAHAASVLPEGGADPELLIDTEVLADELTLELALGAGLLEPFGQSNPPPIFSMRGLRLADQPRVVGNNHLKLSLAAPHCPRVSAIGFGMGAFAAALSRSSDIVVDVAFEPVINDYFAGAEKLEMRLRDLKIEKGH